jgi:hypothetical protein
MAGNFHESFAAAKVKPPSERSTGLVFAGVALLLAFAWRHHPLAPWGALAAAVCLAGISLLAPRLLKPLNVVWFRIGLLLHRIVNPVVMLALFVFVFTPAGFLVRIWHDPLRLRRRSEASSYWIERTNDGPATGSMVNQF